MTLSATPPSSISEASEKVAAEKAYAAASGSPAARRSKFVVFPDAPHAFHADYRPSYRKPAADEGWAQ